MTWEAFGLTTFAVNRFPAPTEPLPPGPPPPPQAPPVGTPWSLSISFDPDAAFHTVLAPSPSSPCSTVGVTGTFTLGGTDYTLSGPSNQGFTNSGLPNSTCIDGPIVDGTIDFFLFPVATEDDPWELRWSPFFLLASYNDLVTNGTFPDSPTYLQAGSLLFNNDSFQFGGRFAPTASGFEQPTAVPEPGTLTMLGIGLAIAARRRRSRERGA